MKIVTYRSVFTTQQVIVISGAQFPVIVHEHDSVHKLSRSHLLVVIKISFYNRLTSFTVWSLFRGLGFK